ncbi:MAG: Ig-like domain-containing protein [Bacteroidales bacterium]|nr:Ig-like domain-containing protein [Bacteroidales bacterium]
MRSFILQIVCILGFSMLSYSQVKFNEVQPSNSKTQMDPDFYKYKDWIELYNTSSSSVDISGYYITDNKDKPRKWQVPNGQSIGAGKYVIIYCDGEDVTGKAMHTNFKLSTSGDKLYMYSSSMLLLDSVSIVDVETDYTYGRQVNGTGAWASLSRPTPGAANVSTTVKGLAPKPVFSIKGGYFNKEQTVSLSTTLSGAVIRYTTDGSEPTENSPIYSGPITAKKETKVTQKYGHNREDKTGVQHYGYPSTLDYPSSKYTGNRDYGFVIKAKVFHDDYVPSLTEANTYFININARSLPVVAISTDFDNFFNKDTGIYIQGVNGLYDGYVTANWRQDWERKVFVEYFDMNGNRQFGVSAGASTMGAVSRNYDMKSLNIVMKKKYEDGEIAYPLFGDDGLSTYKSFVLRNAGNDWEQGSKYRDAAIQQVLRGKVDLETQDFQPVVMYLNGEYWGLINMRERFGEDYFAGYYDYADDIDLLKYCNDSSYNFRAQKGDTKRLGELMTYLANNSMSDDANYQYVKNHYIDVDNMINYYIAQLFSQNTDWPTNNMRMWRPRTENGKFRFPWYDADFGYGLWGGEASTNPWDNFDKSGYKKKTSVAMLNYMLENEEFKAEFVQRFYAMMATVYQSSIFKSIVNNIENQLSAERSALMDEWTCTLNGGDSWGYGAGGMKSWADSRVGHMKDYVNSKFDSKGTTTLNISYTESQGQVFVCTIPVSNGYSATHQKSRAIRLTAEPKDGYVFSAWKNGNTTVSTDPEYFVTITNTTSITAVFSNRSTEKNLYVNEFLASNSTDVLSENNKHEDWIEIYNGGSSTIDLAGLYLSDDTTNLEKYKIPYGSMDKTRIPSKGYVLFWADNEPQDGALHLPFKLDRSEGVIILSQKSSSGAMTVIDKIRYSQQNTDVSYGRYPDGNSNLIIFTQTTPNASNTIVSDTYVDGLVINEFMSKNSSTVREETGSYADWFEIYNTTDKDIDLGGLFVTNDLNNLNKYMIPKGEPTKTTVRAGGYYIFWCDKQTAINPNHVDFKLPAEKGDIAIVQLRGSENYVIDQISYSNQGDDIAYGRYPNPQSEFRYLLTPTPNAQNANTASVHEVSGVTINEVLAVNTSIVADETGAYSDYIEFYNGTNSAIDLGGLFVSDSLGYSLRYRIPTTNSALTTVQAGKWITFWADGKPELGANHLDFSLSGSAGEDVVLSQINANGEIEIIDQVSFDVQTENVSYGRYPELADNWEEMSPTYKAKNQSVNSSVALKTLTASIGEITPSVSTSVLAYECALPAGTTQVPTISATTVHERASVTITQATSLSEQAIVKVISANGYNSETYTVSFKIAASSDATLATLELGGGELSPAFSPTVYQYVARLYTTYVPYLTAIATDPNAMVDIDYAETLAEATVVTVTAENGSTKQYEITYTAASSQNIVTEWSDDFTTGIGNVSTNNDIHKVSWETITTTTGMGPGQVTTKEYKLGVALDEKGTEQEYGYVEYHLPTGYVLDGSSALNVSLDIVGVANGKTLNGVTVDNEYFPFNVALVDVYGNVSDYITPAETINSSTTGTTTLNFATASYITKTAIVAVRFGLYGPGDTRKARKKAAYIDNLVIGPRVATGQQTVVTLSDNADLQSISLNGGLSLAFNKDVHSYTVTLPAGTETIPTVSAVASDDAAYLEVTQASSLDGTAYVKVISQDLTNVNEYEIQYVVTPSVIDGYTDYVVRPAVKGWSESSDLYALHYNGGDMQVAYSRTGAGSDAITYNLVDEDYKILDLSSNPYASVTLKTTVPTSLYVELFDANGKTTASSVAAAQCSAGHEYTTYTFDFTGKFANANSSEIYGMKLYFDKGSSASASGTITIDELRFGTDVEITINAAPVWAEIPEQTIQQGGSFININLTNFASDDVTESSALAYELVNPSEYLNVTITSGVLSVTAKDDEWIGSDIVKVRATDSEGASSIVSITFAVEELKVPLTSVSFSQSKVYVSENATVNLASYLSLVPSNATIESYDWSVSDVQSASVNGVGVLTNKLAYGTEDVIITVVVTDKSGNLYTKTIEATLTGCPTEVALVSTDANLNLFYGEKAQMSYSLTPSNACVKSVTYSSSDKSVATVSETGEVTALTTKGYSDITISVNDGFSVKTAVCRVNVSKDCSGDITLSLNKSSLALVKGQYEQLIATITPNDECTENNVVTWTSSNTQVATVSNGIVNAVGVGPVTITATTTGNGVTEATCTVNVSSDCNSGAVEVVMSETEKTIYKTSTLKLTAEITTNNPCDEEILWSSSDETVATVEDGQITPLKYGTTVIRATARQNADSYAECNLTVAEKEVTDISVTPQAKMMYVGSTQTMTAAITPDDADDKKITWSSSDLTKATISDKGVVTALASGNVTITATAASGVSDYYTLQILDIEITNIVLNIEEVTLTIGDKQQVTVSFEPENATNTELTWSSLDETKATVTADGLIEAVGEGTTTIIVSTKNNVTKVITVNVESEVVAVSSIDVTPASLSMKIGDTQTLTAVVNPDNATNKTLTWSSSNPQVATVSNGVVKAVGQGSAVITVSSANEVTEDVNVTVDYQAITSVTFSESSVALAINQSADLLKLLVLNPTSVTTQSIVWSVSGTGATVDQDGDITNNLMYGTQTVIVTAEVTDMYGTKKTATIPVVLTGCTTRISSISVDNESIEITKTGSAQVNVSITPINACTEYTLFESSNAACATVTKTGKISPVAEGNTIITVTVSDGYSTFQKMVRVSVIKDIIPVSSVTFNQTSAVKYIGDNFQISATVSPDDATTQTLTWTTSDRTKATVDDNGNVTILAAGTVTISATANNGVAASCVITAKPVEVEKIVLNYSELSLLVNGQEDLVATITPSNATDKTITWASSNEAVAVVVNGRITAKKVGTTEITATTVNAKTATCVLTVNHIEPTSITLSPVNCTLEIDETKEISATLAPANVTDTVLTWTSKDENVATVNRGVIKAIAAGSTIVEVVTGNGLKKTVSVTVNPMLATSISLNTTTATLLENEQQQLVATILPEKTTDKSVEWSSTDPSIVSVDVNGKITAKSIGEATIIATTSNGKTASCVVNVTRNVIAVSKVTIEPSSMVLHINENSSLSAVITPTNATNKSLVWASSLTSVATVDQYGNVTANGVGTTTITATSATNNIYGTCIVTVREIEVETITMSNVSLAVGESQTIPVQISPSNATDKTLTWSVGDASIATINENTGKITGVAEGTTTVTARASNGVKSTAQVTVQATAIPVKYIYTNSVTQVEIGDVVDLASLIVFVPENATNKSMKFEITKQTPDYGAPAVVVLNNGMLTAVAAGKATISATALSSNSSTSINIVVSPILATSVSLNKTAMELVIDSQESLTATVNPDNASCKTVTWTSSNPSVAYVSQNGVVYAQSVGTAMITATANDNSNKSAWCEVTVIDNPITKIIPSVSNLSMKKGDIVTVQLTIEPADASTDGITWKSSDPSIVSVENGKLTALGDGQALIRATASSGVYCEISCIVSSQNAPIQIMPIPEQVVNLNDGETLVSIDLNDYFVDESDELLWSIDQGGDNIKAQVTSAGIVTFLIVDSTWSGTQEMTVYAKNSAGLQTSAKVSFTIIGKGQGGGGDAIETIDIRNLAVYPNPTNGPVYVTFETESAENCTVEIYSTTGKKVVSESVFVDGEYSYFFDLSEYDKGIYYVTIETKNGRKTTRIVLK